MRVVMPVAAGADERAWQALVGQAPHAERVDVSGSPTGYYELIASLWAGAEDFAIVEHDVTIAEDTFVSLDACPRPWCSCPSAPRSERWANVLARHPDHAPPADWRPLIEDGYLAGMLQCVRFRCELMVAQPDIVAEIKLSRRFWDALDLTFLPAIDAPVCIHEGLLTDHVSATPEEARARGERVARWRHTHGEPWFGYEREVRWSPPWRPTRLTDTTTQRRDPSSGALPLADHDSAIASVRRIMGRRTLAPSPEEAS